MRETVHLKGGKPTVEMKELANILEILICKSTVININPYEGFV